MESEAPLTWAMGNGPSCPGYGWWHHQHWLSRTRWFLLGLLAAHADHLCYLLLQKSALPDTRGPWPGTTCSPSHLRGQHKTGYCNLAPPVVPLTPLGKHTTWCCHCQMLRALSKPGWGSLLHPRALELGVAYTTFPWVLATVRGPVTRYLLLALSIVTISLEAHAAPYQGDNNQLTVRKKTASNQTPMQKNK